MWRWELMPFYSITLMQYRNLNSAFGRTARTGPKVMKLFSCSTQLSMKFVLLINLKLLTTENSFLLNTLQRRYNAVVGIHERRLRLMRSALYRSRQHPPTILHAWLPFPPVIMRCYVLHIFYNLYCMLFMFVYCWNFVHDIRFIVFIL